MSLDALTILNADHVQEVESALGPQLRVFNPTSGSITLLNVFGYEYDDGFNLF